MTPASLKLTQFFFFFKNSCLPHKQCCQSTTHNLACQAIWGSQKICCQSTTYNLACQALWRHWLSCQTEGLCVCSFYNHLICLVFKWTLIYAKFDWLAICMYIAFLFASSNGISLKSCASIFVCVCWQQWNLPQVLCMHLCVFAGSSFWKTIEMLKKYKCTIVCCIQWLVQGTLCKPLNTLGGHHNPEHILQTYSLFSDLRV